MNIASMIRRLAATTVAMAGLVVGSQGVAGQTHGAPERFSAFAVNMNDGGSAQVQIVVNRWSTNRVLLQSVKRERASH